MRLVARQSVQFFADFGDIPWMHHVRNGVTHDGMAFAVLNWEHHHFVLFEVIVRQGHRAVENLQDSSGFVFLRRSTWTVALQARSVSVGTEKFVSLAAVWFVTGATTLHKCGLVVDPLLCQIRDVRMTAQADFNGGHQTLCIPHRQTARGAGTVFVGREIVFLPSGFLSPASTGAVVSATANISSMTKYAIQWERSLVFTVVPTVPAGLSDWVRSSS
ncbi:MAG TPA: hypothetical protein VK703_10390 [Candidatus Acidoferrales bacterium]|nr:hypothetical protein [Candidatus Acidoferrales bacterium]